MFLRAKLAWIKMQSLKCQAPENYEIVQSPLTEKKKNILNKNKLRSVT